MCDYVRETDGGHYLEKTHLALFSFSYIIQSIIPNVFVTASHILPDLCVLGYFCHHWVFVFVVTSSPPKCAPVWEKKNSHWMLTFLQHFLTSPTGTHVVEEGIRHLVMRRDTAREQRQWFCGKITSWGFIPLIWLVLFCCVYFFLSVDICIVDA